MCGAVRVADERLSSLDQAFLCLESAGAPMQLGALAVFQPPQPVRASRLVTLLCERAERLTWLRRRVSAGWLRPGAGTWVEDRLLDIGRHVHLHQLRDGQHEELAALAAELMAEPLDLGRPLWQL